MRNMLYTPIALGDTADLDEATWLKWRDHGPWYEYPESEHYVSTAIGGSDVSTVFGINPWKTPLELYHQKIMALPKINIQKNKDAKAAGHIYEPYVAEAFRQYMLDPARGNCKTCEIINDTRLFRSGEIEVDEDGDPVLDDITGKPVLNFPFALANLDRICIVNGTRCILECKTTSSHNFETIKKWKESIVPIYYELQCRYYMAIMNIDRCYICCCWGFTKDDMAVICIERDLEYEELIMSTVKTFVFHIENHIEPDLSICNDDLLFDYYSRYYGAIDEKAAPIELGEKYRDYINSAVDISSQIEKHEKIIASLKKKQHAMYNKMYPVLQNRCGVFQIDDTHTAYVTLKTSYKRAKLDTDRLKKEQPAVYDKYVETSSNFNETKFKKDEKKLSKEYMSKPEINPEKLNSFDITVKEHDKPAV